jgi:hypothetical protein
VRNQSKNTQRAQRLPAAVGAKLSQHRAATAAAGVFALFVPNPSWCSDTTTTGLTLSLAMGFGPGLIVEAALFR